MTEEAQKMMEEILAEAPFLVEREMTAFLNGGWELLDPDFANAIGTRLACLIHAHQHDLRISTT